MGWTKLRRVVVVAATDPDYVSGSPYPLPFPLWLRSPPPSKFLINADLRKFAVVFMVKGARVRMFSISISEFLYRSTNYKLLVVVASQEVG